MSIASKDRAWIIEMGVRFESSISWAISQRLGISPVESISFGSSSQCLGFNQRMNLLIDMQILSKMEKSKFEAFMVVRNKFAHVWDIDSLHRFFIKYPDQLKFIEKHYKNDIHDFKMEYCHLNKELNPDYDLKLNDPERYFVGCFGIFYNDLCKIIERVQEDVRKHFSQ